METNRIEVPAEWEALPVHRWGGAILIIGAPNSGKSTFGRTLYGRLAAQGQPVAYLDADVGQQALGPPTSLILALPGQPAGPPTFPPTGPRWMRFAGNNSPRGHMLPVILGLHHLRDLAWQAGTTALVVETSGFVDAERGAATLKWAKVELLRPQAVVAFQHEKSWNRSLAPCAGCSAGGYTSCPSRPRPAIAPPKSAAPTAPAATGPTSGTPGRRPSPTSAWPSFPAGPSSPANCWPWRTATASPWPWASSSG